MCSRHGRKKLPGNDKPARIARLLVELLNSDELAELAIGGAWSCLKNILLGAQPALCRVILDLDICGLALTHLQQIGSAADWTVSGALMR